VDRAAEPYLNGLPATASGFRQQLEADKQRLADAEQRLTAAVVEAEGWRQAAEAEFAGKNRVAAAAAALQHQLTAAEQQLISTEQRLAAAECQVLDLTNDVVSWRVAAEAAEAEKNRFSAAASDVQQRLVSMKVSLEASQVQLDKLLGYNKDWSSYSLGVEAERDKQKEISHQLHVRNMELHRKLSEMNRECELTSDDREQVAAELDSLRGVLQQERELLDLYRGLFVSNSEVAEVSGKERLGEIVNVDDMTGDVELRFYNNQKKWLTATEFKSGWVFR
jgi:chromosome segregation ATPase